MKESRRNSREIIFNWKLFFVDCCAIKGKVQAFNYRFVATKIKSTKLKNHQEKVSNMLCNSFSLCCSWCLIYGLFVLCAQHINSLIQKHKRFWKSAISTSFDWNQKHIFAVCQLNIWVMTNGFKFLFLLFRQLETESQRHKDKLQPFSGILTQKKKRKKKGWLTSAFV